MLMKLQAVQEKTLLKLFGVLIALAGMIVMRTSTIMGIGEPEIPAEFDVE